MSLPPSDHAAPAASHIGGQGSDLVLLHGLGGTWEMWKPVIAALEARHRVIALTLPGHYGGPDYRGDGDASVAGLADQLIETPLRAMAQTRIFVPLLRTMGRDGPVAPLDPGRVPVRVAWGGCDATQPVVALRHHRAAARGLQGRGQGGRGLGQRLLPVRPDRRLSAQPPTPTPSCSCSACARASTKCSPSANPTRRNRSPRTRWPASRRARPPRQPGKRNDH